MPIPGHNIPMAMIGTFILAFGWFGFNPGSTLAGADLRIAVVAVNTMLAGATGAFAAMLYMWMVRSGKPDPEHDVQRHAGRPGRDHRALRFVNAPAACLIGSDRRRAGGRGGVLHRTQLKIDDPVGAIAVHGVNGAWGCLALGLFADGTYGDGWNGVPGTVTGSVLWRCFAVLCGMHRRWCEHRCDRDPWIRHVQGDRSGHRPSCRSGKRKSKDWMFPKWAFLDTSA